MYIGIDDGRYIQFHVKAYIASRKSVCTECSEVKAKCRSKKKETPVTLNRFASIFFNILCEFIVYIRVVVLVSCFNFENFNQNDCVVSHSSDRDLQFLMLTILWYHPQKKIRESPATNNHVSRFLFCSRLERFFFVEIRGKMSNVFFVFVNTENLFQPLTMMYHPHILKCTWDIFITKTKHQSMRLQFACVNVFLPCQFSDRKSQLFSVILSNKVSFVMKMFR